jgi:hypothetical protein
MTQFIQKFIEKNIDLIEDNEWNEVFLNWYNDAEEIWPDDSDEFKQFISILLDAGIDPVLDEIETVLYDEIEFMMDAEKNSFMNTNHHISIFQVMNKLNSRLGYTEQDIKKIMNNIASKLGMHYTEYYGGGYAW